jgi:G3E family GTPase
LRHQLHTHAFGRVHVLVNEAAETPVDDALLLAADRMTVLAGGCSCCLGKAELISVLRRLCDERSRVSSDPRLERIVLETSGLADPGAIVQAIQSDSVLVNHIVIDETIVAIDALHALAQLKTESLGRRQIAAADRLILTKIDAADPTQLARLRATLAVMNPAAPMTATIKGETVGMPDLPPGTEAEILPVLSAEDARGPIFPTRLVIDDDIDWSAFTLWLSALLHARGDDLVRVKGVVRTPAGRLLLQTVRHVVQSPEILPEQGDGRDDGTIVFLGRGYRPEDLRKSLLHFAGKTGQKT